MSLPPLLPAGMKGLFYFDSAKSESQQTTVRLLKNHAVIFVSHSKEERMDIVFSHETALQICAQLKTGGNGEALLRRSSKDFHTTYSACSTEAYEEKLLFLKKEYGIVLAQTTHEILRKSLPPYYVRLSHIRLVCGQRKETCTTSFLMLLLPWKLKWQSDLHFRIRRVALISYPLR